MHAQSLSTYRPACVSRTGGIGSPSCDGYGIPDGYNNTNSHRLRLARLRVHDAVLDDHLRRRIEHEPRAVSDLLRPDT